ncbi:MAG: serine/threonine protein kinase [Thermoguttaceae bacterium]|nr:serine/threonine protein kinase [Thermoguttaceae bacterium]MDW8077741.1 serine/threonine-protein kinase [Thermoguttaceae bacterium]
MERYEILAQIAVGDFAIIYRARDRELLREVAIKQIHSQYLADPRQLERFWREAQMLASLQHPHIITIFDVVRPKGWLIMELMQGSVRDLSQGQPLDVDLVRTILASCLDALRFLHAQGIIHGDIKPSNILVDRDGRIKLGDFGLARRATGKDGSLLKGTTKYTAPEVIAPQFGEVGAASDLYSLGFTAYELLCGERFMDLFPGLSTFGRDQQMAWLMWHAAPDLRLPPVGRVLQGVPADVARVIDGLVQKEQARRFASAEEALSHLALGGPGMPPPRVVQPATPLASPKKPAVWQRILAGIAVIVAIAASIWLLWPETAPPPQPAPPVWGIIRVVDAGDRRLEILREDAPKIIDIRVTQGDEFILNGQAVSLRQLREGDRVKVEQITDQQGRVARRVTAFRPQTFMGSITQIDGEKQQLTLAVDGSKDPLTILASDKTKVFLNNEELVSTDRPAWQLLRVGDKVEAEAVPDEVGWHGRTVRAIRLIRSEGLVRLVDPQAKRLVWQETGNDRKQISASWGAGCVVLLNGQSQLSGKQLGPGDLAPDDKVTVEFDTEIRRVEAYRVFQVQGTIATVDYARGIVALQEHALANTFRVENRTSITLEGEQATVADLRIGDQATVRFDDLAAATPPAMSLDVRRPPDPSRWAVLIAVATFDDPALSSLPFALNNVAQLEDRLQRRYRVPASNLIKLVNPTRFQIEEAFKQLPSLIKQTQELIVYVLSNAYVDEAGIPYVAARDFHYMKMAETGIELKWLVAQLESCDGSQKLLLLDVCHQGKGADLVSQPSSAELVQRLSPPGRRLPMRTVTVITNCSPGERGLFDAAAQIGLFGRELAQGYAGEADGNRDGRINVPELFAFLQQRVAAAAKALGGLQNPKLFLPDNRPPRLTQPAKDSIRRLTGYLRQEKPDLKSAKQEYDAAVLLAKNEPEPHLIYALLLLRSRERDEAASILAQLRVQRPELLVVPQAFVWLELDRRNPSGAVGPLMELGSLLAKTASTVGSADPFLTEIANWCGRLREYAGSLEDLESVLSKVDAQMAQCGPSLHQAYQRGREEARAVLKRFDEQMASADPLSLPQLRVEKRQLRHYASFPYETWIDRILAGLDDE